MQKANLLGSSIRVEKEVALPEGTAVQRTAVPAGLDTDVWRILGCSVVWVVVVRKIRSKGLLCLGKVRPRTLCSPDS